MSEQWTANKIMPAVQPLSDEPICTDCTRSHDDCPNCCGGDLYLSPDSYEKFEDR